MEVFFCCLNLLLTVYNKDILYKTIAFFFFAALSIPSSYAQEKKYYFSEAKMGSPFSIILVSGDSLKAAVLAHEAYALIDSFNTLFSDYDTSSELSRLNAAAGKGKVSISPSLWNMISHSKMAYEKSEGAFDITIGPLSHLWRVARKEKRFPDSLSVNVKRKIVGFYHIRTDSMNREITLPVTGMKLDLGGIAKGYIAQQVIGFLKSRGITRALADAGGDIVMSGAPPGTKGWLIGVNMPETTDKLLPKKLLLKNMAVATSGDAYQYLEHHGIRYSHIVDPRTGYGISSQRNVTVIANSGTDADWLATACSILPIASAKKLVLALQAEVLITELVNGKIIYHSTKGFSRYLE